MKRKIKRTEFIILAIVILLLSIIACNKSCVTRPYPTVIIHGYVEDSVTGFPIKDVFVVLNSIEDTTTLNSDYTNGSGYYSFSVCFYFDSFPISVFKSDYISASKYISSNTEDSVTANFKLQPIQ